MLCRVVGAGGGRPRSGRPRASPGRGGWPGSVAAVSPSRRCSRTACGRTAIWTLTYVYADQTAVLGPLSLYAEPHAYDLCAEHGERLSAPRGWDVLRLAADPGPTGPSQDDLLALADAVREAARPAPEPVPFRKETGREVARRGHLRMLTSD